MQAGLEAMLVQICRLCFESTILTEDHGVSACAEKPRRLTLSLMLRAV